MNYTDKEPLISHPWVSGVHVLIVITNIVSVLFSISWVWYIYAQINQTRRVQKRLEGENGDVACLKETRTKIKKYLLYLVIMVIEAFHVALRLVIYIIFTVLDLINVNALNASCEEIDEYKAYNFIENLMPYQFIWIGLSHSLALALMISLIVTLLYLRETYSYYGKKFKWFKIWIIIGIIQFLTVWLLLSIPWVALLGSVLFTVFAIVDFIMLYTTAKRLLSILNMRLVDLRYEHEKYHSFRRALVTYKWFGLFLLSLLVYLVGIILAHVAIWLSISPCYFNRYLSIRFHPNTTEVQIIADVASVVWLLDYLAILQFDVALLVGNIAYLIYRRVKMRDVNAETRQLLREYSDSVYKTRDCSI